MTLIPAAQSLPCHAQTLSRAPNFPSPCPTDAFNSLQLKNPAYAYTAIFLCFTLSPNLFFFAQMQNPLRVHPEGFTSLFS